MRRVTAAIASAALVSRFRALRPASVRSNQLVHPFSYPETSTSPSCPPIARRSASARVAIFCKLQTCRLWQNSFSPVLQFGFCHSSACDESLVDEITEILKANSEKEEHEIRAALGSRPLEVDEGTVLNILRRHRSHWKLALAFFQWASDQPGYTHGSRAWNETLDILGRLKRVSQMRNLFDEIPKELVNNATFAIMINRYAGAHKVQEAIDTFYRRTEYGLELDLVGFQTLLMSLCRYKHVEEAEALFLQKKDKFPPAIKTMNIILNGWCVLGSSRDATRFWNEIIASTCKPDLITYGTFINSLTKAGKLGTAVKLFESMWNKGLEPDTAICNCIIDALCFKKKIPEALNVFKEMDKRGRRPDVATYNSLIKHLCRIGRMEKVHELLDEMNQKGCPPNTRTYSAILKTLKRPEEVSGLLKRMRTGGCAMDADTYNLVLGLYVAWKHWRGAESLWAEMERNGMGPDQRSYTVIIHGLHFDGKEEEALQYYSEMKKRELIPEPRTTILIKAIRMKKEKRAGSNGDSLHE